MLFRSTLRSAVITSGAIPISGMTIDTGAASICSEHKIGRPILVVSSGAVNPTRTPQLVNQSVNQYGVPTLATRYTTPTIITTKEFNNEIIHASFFSSVITILAAMAVRIKIPKKADDACTRSLIINE